MEKYYIDLDTILQILQGFHQNGVLHGDLPAKKLGNKVPWKAQLRMLEGKVITCSILDHQGDVVSSGEATLKALRGAGMVSWEMIAEPQTGTMSVPVIRPGSLSGPLSSASNRPFAPQQSLMPRYPIPRRLVSVTSEQMTSAQWPRYHRMVYVLIDGVRSSEKIANMLSLRPEDVEQVLRDLQHIRVIMIDR